MPKVVRKPRPRPAPQPHQPPPASLPSQRQTASPPPPPPPPPPANNPYYERFFADYWTRYGEHYAGGSPGYGDAAAPPPPRRAPPTAAARMTGGRVGVPPRPPVDGGRGGGPADGAAVRASEKAAEVRQSAEGSDQSVPNFEEFGKGMSEDAIPEGKAVEIDEDAPGSVDVNTTELGSENNQSGSNNESEV